MKIKNFIIKNINKLKNIISLLLIASTTLFAQSTAHTNFWNKLAINKPLSNKINIEVEFQKRYQEDINHNFAENKLLSSIRFWIYYKINDKINLIASPFAYFENNPIIIKESDVNKILNYENRYAVAIELTQKLNSKIKFQNRTGIEFRNFINTSPDYFRFREKLSIKYTLTSKISLNGYDEILINSNSGEGLHYFDQNRLGSNISYNPNKNIKIEIGFIKIEHSQRNPSDILSENNFVLNTFFTLPNKN